MEDMDGTVEQTAPVWAVFGDLMSGLLGAFILILVGVLGVQLELASKLESEIQQRQIAEQRRSALEEALAGPLASGRVTLNNGRIGISGSVLFATNSAALQPEGRQLLTSLVEPLRAYLGAREELLMVSGFTDDRAIATGKDRFEDNWELSVASNADAKGRSQNRRVEMAPVPRASTANATASVATRSATGNTATP